MLWRVLKPCDLIWSHWIPLWLILKYFGFAQYKLYDLLNIKYKPKDETLQF